MFAGRSPDVVLVAAHADRHDADRRPVLRRGHGVDRVLVHDLAADDVLGVDDGRLARNGDGLFKRADTKVGVDRGRKGCRELDALALDRREPGEGERHGIGAGPKVNDVVPSLAVGRDRADLLDQHGTAGFDGYSRHHRTARVANDARNAASLPECQRRREHECRQYESSGYLSHMPSTETNLTESSDVRRDECVMKPCPEETWGKYADGRMPSRTLRLAGIARVSKVTRAIQKNERTEWRTAVDRRPGVSA